MGKYITWDDIVLKYKHVGRKGDASEIASHYIFYAEAELEGRLGAHFTVPFSSNNVTAKDLCIDMAYSRMSVFKGDEAKEFRTILEDRLERIISGRELMMTTSAETIETDRENFFSTTENYHPTFGIDNAEYLQVSSSWLQDEEDDR